MFVAALRFNDAQRLSLLAAGYLPASHRQVRTSTDSTAPSSRTFRDICVNTTRHWITQYSRLPGHIHDRATRDRSSPGEKELVITAVAVSTLEIVRTAADPTDRERSRTDAVHPSAPGQVRIGAATRTRARGKSNRCAPRTPEIAPLAPIMGTVDCGSSLA